MAQSHKRYQDGLSTSGLLAEFTTPKEKPILIGPPMEGLNWYDAQANVGINETPYCTNARIGRGYLRPRPGLTLNYTFTGETVMYIREHTTRAGQTYLLVITNKSIYKSTDFTTYTRIPWYYSTGTVTTVEPSATVEGASTVWLTNAHAGDLFKCDADGTWFTIDSITDNDTLVLTAGYTPSRAGVAYKIDRYLSGTTADTFWGLTIADADWFVFCNGVDPVLYLDENMDVVYTLYSIPAKYGTTWADRLILGYTTESAVVYGYRMRYSVAADYDNFTGTGSGYHDFMDDPYDITGYSIISDTLVVYKTYSIFNVTRTGKASAPFDYKLKVPGIGNYIPGHLVSLGDADVFTGSDNFYTYDLRSPVAIGDKVKDRFLDQLNPNALDICHALVCEEDSEIQFYYCSASSTTPDRALVWNYDLNSFISEWLINTNCSGYASYITTSTWNSMTQAWDEVGAPWDSSTVVAARPLNMLGYGAYLYILDTNSTSDNGTDFTMEWWTKQIVSADETKFVSVYRIVLAYYCSSPTTLYVDLSPDGGNSWYYSRTLTLTSTVQDKLQYIKADFISSYNSVTARIRCTAGGYYKIINVKLEAVPAGEI